MRLPIFLDKLTRRFNPMDDKVHLELTSEFTDEYTKIIDSAKHKKTDNEVNLDVADYTPKKLTIKERIALILDSIWVRYIIALLFPVIVSFFVKKQQIQEPETDFDDDDDDDDYPNEKTDLKQVIKLLKRQL